MYIQFHYQKEMWWLSGRASGHRFEPRWCQVVTLSRACLITAQLAMALICPNMTEALTRRTHNTKYQHKVKYTMQQLKNLTLNKHVLDAWVKLVLLV